MSFSDWKKKKSKVIKTALEEPVTKTFLNDDKTMPLVYKPNVALLNLANWFNANKQQIQQDLDTYGAVLFRGFKVDNRADFKAFTEVAFTNKAAYVEGATPRTELDDGIYTSTEFDASKEIGPHNELSYVTHPPAYLAFCCLVAAETGGQTPITDVAAVHDNIDDDILDQFNRRGGWLLKRNYITGFGPTIFKAYGKDTIEQIKQYCDQADVELEVLSDDHSVTRQRRAAVHQHPRLDLKLWFNHVVFWHPQSLCPKVLAHMQSQLTPSQFPYHTSYADGQPIDADTISRINQAYASQEVVFDWVAGDILLLDNWRVAHGRKPYSGNREVLVAMG